LCKRGIPPSYGKWTIPAGFMEMGESSFQGAKRETLEETGLNIQTGQLLGVYNLVSAGQVLTIGFWLFALFMKVLGSLDF